MQGNSVLKGHKKTPSGIINKPYDFLIRKNQLPWKEELTGIASMTEDQIEDARKFIQSIPFENTQFATMSDEDIRNERLKAKGLICAE